MTHPFRLLVPLLVCCLFTACRNTRSGAEEDKGGTSAVVVAVTAVPLSTADVPVTVSATGTTDVMRKSRVLAPIAGVLTSVRVVEGSVVHRGDVVAVIEPRETHAAIQGAEALLRDASTDAQRSEARRALELARRNASGVEVRAAIDGVVTSRPTAAGEPVAENAELATLVDVSSLVFLAQVPVEDLQRITLHERAVVVFAALPGERYDAVVDAVLPNADPLTQAAQVRLVFTRPVSSARSPLKIGMAGTTDIVIDVHRNAFVTRKSALMRDDETGATTIAVATAEGFARILRVNVGVRTDSTAEIMAPGLTTGMNVITVGNGGLTDSTRVSVGPQQP